MDINIQLKIFTLLCILHATNIGASAPASQAAIPASLQAELKRIKDLPDHKVLTEVVSYPIDVAAQWLRESEDKLKVFDSSLLSLQANVSRSLLTYWAIKKELASCPNGHLKQILQTKFNDANNQFDANEQKVDWAVKNKPLDAYNLVMHIRNALAHQAAILLAQKETLGKEKSQLQKEKVQWQQEKQALLAQLKGYQLLVDGPQIEGVPNVPGGVNPGIVKPKLKRSGSF